MRDILEKITQNEKSKTIFCILIAIPVAAIVLFLNFSGGKEVQTEVKETDVVVIQVDGSTAPSTTTTTTTTTTTAEDTNSTAAPTESTTLETEPTAN